MSGIYGGFEELLYTSDNLDDTPTCRGITTRLNPILDPSNISIRGTGNRNLYDILLGMRRIQVAIDILPTNIDFIKTYQNGQAYPAYIHYANKTNNTGLTFVAPRFNRMSLESRHNEAIRATIEVWAEDLVDPAGTTLPAISGWPSAPSLIIPYRWSHSTLTISDPTPTVEDAWWSWRYEVNNNLQILGNVDDGGIRDIVPKHSDVSGLIIKDMASFSEWTELMKGTVGRVLGAHPTPEEPKINIKIEIDGSNGPSPPYDTDSVTLLDKSCRWGRIEAPTGAEDLQAKRFPFTALGIG